MSKRIANATVRRSGQKCVTVPVSFSLTLDDLLLLYLLDNGARNWVSSDEEAHLATMPLPKSKIEAFESISKTLRNYGDDYTYRTEEMPDGWENHEQVLKIKAKLSKLFNF